MVVSRGDVDVRICTVWLEAICNCMSDEVMHVVYERWVDINLK